MLGNDFSPESGDGGLRIPFSFSSLLLLEFVFELVELSPDADGEVGLMTTHDFSTSCRTTGHDC